MKDENKTKAQLIGELSLLRNKVAALEGIDQTGELDEKIAMRSSDMAQEYLDIAGFMIIVIDAENRVSLINKRGCKILGYRQEEIIGEKWLDKFVPRKERGEVKKCFERLIKGEISSEDHYENSVVTKNGDERTILWHNTILRDEKRDIIGTLSSGEDITERKRAEEKLREAELRYRIVADFTYDWEYWVNPDGSLRYVSPSCERITGYKAKEFIEDPHLIGKIIVPEDEDIWHRHEHDAREEHKLREVQFRIKRQDGDLRWIEHACRPVHGTRKAFLGFRCSNRDITERKHADEALRQNEQRLELAFAGANLGVWDWDVQSGKVIPNERWAAMMGYSLDDIQKEYGFWEKIVHPDDLPGAVRNLKDHLEGRADCYKSEYRLRTKSGEWRYIQSRGKVSERDKNEKPVRAVGVNIDVTEQKRTIEALKQATQEILEVSTPTLRVWEGLAIVPLIGTLDSERTQLFIERFLTSIVETKSAVALVDITGVPTVDTQTAQHLIEAITAARLLGTKVILTGVRASIAQTIVHLGIDLAEIETCASLTAGFQKAMEMVNLEVTPKNQRNVT